MPQITFRQSDGSETIVNASLGCTVMEAATIAGVDGIVAECGGNVTCSTCHVFVDPDFGHGLFPPLSEDEDYLLDSAASPRRPTSRLSCQLPVVEKVDGLVVDLPETQI